MGFPEDRRLSKPAGQPGVLRAIVTVQRMLVMPVRLGGAVAAPGRGGHREGGAGRGTGRGPGRTGARARRRGCMPGLRGTDGAGAQLLASSHRPDAGVGAVGVNRQEQPLVQRGGRDVAEGAGDQGARTPPDSRCHIRTAARSRWRDRAGRGAAAGRAHRFGALPGRRRDELRGLRVDSDVPAEQHPADDLPGVPGRVLRAAAMSALPLEVVVHGGAVHADGLGDLGDGVLPLAVRSGGGRTFGGRWRPAGCSAWACGPRCGRGPGQRPGPRGCPRR